MLMQNKPSPVKDSSKKIISDDSENDAYYLFCIIGINWARKFETQSRKVWKFALFFKTEFPDNHDSS